MDFALLGDDPAVLPLVRAIAAGPGRRLVAATGLGATAAEIVAAAPGMRVCDGWDRLLLQDTVDAAIVAGSDPQLLEGAKQLGAGGAALIVFPQSRQESTFVYELALIHDDRQVVLFPALSERLHPLVAQLRELIDSGVLGPIQYLQFERVHPEASGLVSRTAIEDALLADADLLRTLGGNYDQVTALETGVAGEKVSLATLTLAGAGLAEATWSLKASDHAAWTLTVHAAGETARLWGTGDWSTWRLERSGAMQGDPQPADAGAALLAAFEKAVSGRAVRPDWADLSRAFEIVDASRRSLARRRTIDLHFETHSERSNFKTQMTAAGCGLLVFTLLAVLCYLLAATLLPLDGALLQIGRALVFLPLGLFLLLQLLVFLARPSSTTRSSDRRIR